MAVLTLHGGVTYNIAEVEENVDPTSQTFRDRFATYKCGDYPWFDTTRLLANFNRNISGSNFGGDFDNIIKFVVFKTIGNQTKLHKVCETVNSFQRIIEDFAVGDFCDYQYHIFAVCNNHINVDGTNIKVEGITPILTQPVKMHTGIVSVVGLKEVDKNLYIVDENNVWHIQYNLRDNGYTLNTDKTFHQTQHAYGKETAGNRKQRSIPISGLLGNINCPEGKFIDDFNYIIEWENFAASSSPKMLIDVRGIITIGDIDVNPQFSYEQTPNHEVSVSFTFVQTNSLDNVDVLGRTLPINPLYYTYLAEAEDSFLKENGYTTSETPSPRDRQREWIQNQWLAAALTEETE